MSLLKLDHISAFYGPSQALFDVDFALGEGEVMALMGRNGMGKTTTIKVICRLLAHRGGTLLFDGQDMAHVPAHRAARAGIGLAPEGRRCFAPLTVLENLTAAARRGPWDVAAVARLFPRLGERKGQVSASLSGGEQQMLAIARALMTNPRLLILDEATEGLAPTIRAEIWQALKSLKAQGQSLLVVDKSLRELAPIADTATLMEKGRTVWTGPFDALTSETTDRYLGV